MRISTSHPFFWFIIGGLFIFFTYSVVSQFDTSDQKLEKAYTSYLEGEKAKSITDRKQAFNEAFAIYKGLSNEYAPTSGNGKLDYNLGNTAFQLEEYPLAVLHYLRAKTLSPRDEKIQTNLNVAFNKLNIPKKDQNSSLSTPLLYFHNKLSLPERVELFTFLSLALLILGTIAIWKPFKGINVLCYVTCFILALIGVSIFTTQFLTPSYAVVLKSSMMYKDAGTQFATVLDKPLTPGSELEVLQVLHAGKWLKVETSEGIVGYIPYDKAEII